MLDPRVAERRINKEHYEWYRDLGRYGSVPHAGFGLGFERTIAYVTGLAATRSRSRSRKRGEMWGIKRTTILRLERVRWQVLSLRHLHRIVISPTLSGRSKSAAVVWSVRQIDGENYEAVSSIGLAVTCKHRPESRP
jgi:hypothetical protein